MEFPVFSSMQLKKMDGSSIIYDWISERSKEKGVNFIYTDREIEDGEEIISRKWRTFDDERRTEPPFEQHGDTLISKSFSDVPQLLGFGIPEPFNKSIVEPNKIVYKIIDTNILSLIAPLFDQTLVLFNSIFLQSENKVYESHYQEPIIDKIDLEPLNKNLNSCSPIEKVRFDQKRVLQYVDETTNTLVLENLMLQFFVAGKWLYWTQLSDGTKRLFYLISTITYCEQFILLEEPELGIHPDQLYKFMDFLKEQSKEKQIILTTHSPDVLNILEKNELDRIIVTRYDAEKGTQMHHLSPNQVQKAHIYMEETGDVSDFWVHSNLEEYEAAS